MAAFAPTHLPAVESEAVPAPVASLADLPPAMEIADVADALPADAPPEPDAVHGESMPPANAPIALDAAQGETPPPSVPPPAAAQRPTPRIGRPMAEEIRMQVLQRIDLFTDTGLRTQLGERLQPIVDRASADLVATINQHVGELLRAYVAEAIEREIDSWRRNH